MHRPKGASSESQGGAQRHPGLAGASGTMYIRVRTVVFRPFRACGIYGVPNPRASLRFALGYFLAPRWGFLGLDVDASAYIQTIETDSRKLDCIMLYDHGTIPRVARATNEPCLNQ